MAATVNYSRPYMADPHMVQQVQLSSVVAGQSEDVAHGGPTGKKCSFIEMFVVTPPTAPCTFQLYHDPANDSTANDTARVKIVAEDGGDLAGLVVNLHIHFKHFKTGGNS